MSSFYTTAQLEAERKARLKQEMSDEVSRLKEQLRQEHDNKPQSAVSSHTAVTVFASDDAVGGFRDDAVAVGSALHKNASESTEQRDPLDFSGLLYSSHKKAPTKMESELDSWMQKIDERPILTEEDEAARTRLLSELAVITRDPAIDIEDKLKMVRMRVRSYLQKGAQLTPSDIDRMESEYYEYCALCQMLGEEPRETRCYRIKKEIVRMRSLLEQRRQDEYVMSVIEDVMGELGCHVECEAVLDETSGKVFSVDGHPLCNIFVAKDGSGIMFEPVGSSANGSPEERRQIEESANSVCSLYDALAEKAAQRGVILKRVYVEPAHIESMCVRSDLNLTAAEKKKKKKKTEQKQRAMGSEE